MHLASDYIHPTPRGGRCRIRIYLPEEEQDAPVVISSELPNNPGGSITNSAEVIAAGVIQANELPTPSGMDRALAQGDYRRTGDL
jgi:predicted acyl esterase